MACSSLIYIVKIVQVKRQLFIWLHVFICLVQTSNLVRSFVLQVLRFEWDTKSFSSKRKSGWSQMSRGCQRIRRSKRIQFGWCEKSSMWIRWRLDVRCPVQSRQSEWSIHLRIQFVCVSVLNSRVATQFRSFVTHQQQLMQFPDPKERNKLQQKSRSHAQEISIKLKLILHSKLRCL